MSDRRLGLVLLYGLLLWMTGPAAAFDHSHTDWQTLLQAHVQLINQGRETRVDYRAMQRDREKLKHYLDSLSGVTSTEYAGWNREQKLAFLINAYNAFTIELILTRYPDLESVKDLGSLFRSPWKIRFFRLLGEEQHLDGVEHGLIRQPGVFDEPRIHMAVVCASIGCPALSNQAYTAMELERQLDRAVELFLSDRTRNRYESNTQLLSVSRIFDWYGDDFSDAHGSLAGFFLRYADALGLPEEVDPGEWERQVRIDFLDYDWGLNDTR